MNHENLITKKKSVQLNSKDLFNYKNDKGGFTLNEKVKEKNYKISKGNHQKSPIKQISSFDSLKNSNFIENIEERKNKKDLNISIADKGIFSEKVKIETNLINNRTDTNKNEKINLNSNLINDEFYDNFLKKMRGENEHNESRKKRKSLFTNKRSLNSKKFKPESNQHLPKLEMQSRNTIQNLPDSKPKTESFNLNFKTLKGNLKKSQKINSISEENIEGTDDITSPIHIKIDKKHNNDIVNIIDNNNLIIKEFKDLETDVKEEISKNNKELSKSFQDEINKKSKVLSLFKKSITKKGDKILEIRESLKIPRDSKIIKKIIAPIPLPLPNLQEINKEKKNICCFSWF